MKGKINILGANKVVAAVFNQVKAAEKITLDILKYAGETFVRNARLNREFEDETGNLQSSIGYVILKDGKEVFDAINGLDTRYQELEGRDHGKRLASAIAKEYQHGWVLIGLAGMEYGIWVESRGIDVISGSIPQTQKLIKEIFNELNR